MEVAKIVKWPLKTFGECATLLSGGTPSKKVARYWDGEIPWVSAKDLKVSRISSSELYVTQEGAKNGTRLVPDGTILFVVRGMSLAKEFRIGISQIPLTFNQDLKALKVHDGVDANFLYYWLVASTPNIIASTGEAAHGTKKLESDRILSLRIFIPTLNEQRRIAVTLARFDDLIENNRRRIALLEETLRQLYKEWFVRFHFPGHETTKVTKGVPMGWQMMPVADWLDSHIGGGWGEDFIVEDHNEAGFVIRGTDLPQVALGQIDRVPFRFHKSSNLKSRTLSDGDLVFEVSGGSKGQPVGRSLLISSDILESFDSPVICASFCKKLRPSKREYAEYMNLHLQFIREVGYMDVFATQSASNITNFKFTAFLTQHSFPLPSQEVLQKFNTIVCPIYKQIRTLGRQNLRLAEARDLLLPRLMSGEITV